ncbi:hypothetical protein [Paenibacillus sp. GYB003]|uniref:hypothetical protein n=1 Tax=Paenibacillus sp. GYB003 TaxID=2994392 RepID=UPI002F96BB9E
MSQERKQEIKNQIDHLNKQIESGVSMHAADTYRQQIAVLESELAQIEQTEQEHAAREQKTEELMDEYNETLNSIFDALLPEDKFAAILGLNEYEQLRQDYKRVHNAYYSDKVAKLNEEHAQEIENWREKFGRLTKQAQETENQLAQTRKELEVGLEANSMYAVENEELTRKVEELRLEIDEKADQFLNIQAENKRLVSEIEELKSKLEQAQKPKDTAKSEALNKVLDEIKSRQKDDPDAMMQRFLARQQQSEKTVMKIDHLSKTVELPELPFRPQMDTQMAQQSADPLPTVVTQDQFRSSVGNMGEQATSAEDGDGTHGNLEGRRDDETVSRAEFEALEARVTELEKQRAQVA